MKEWHKPLLYAGLALLLSKVPIALTAAERHFAGPRAVGMAGANVASATPEQATTYNPAVLGFVTWDAGEETTGEERHWLSAKRHHFAFGLSAGIQLRGSMQDTLDSLTAAEENLTEVRSSEDLSAVETETYVQLLEDLITLETDAITVDGDANVILQARRGRWSLGAIGWFDSSSFVTDADLENIVVNTANTLAKGLNNNAAKIIGLDPDDYKIQYLDADQVEALSDNGYTEDAIKALDSEIGNLTDEQLEKLVDAIVAIPLGDIDDLADNETRVTLASLTVFEVPLSYGYAVNEHLSFGATVKAMYGIVGGAEVRVFDEETDELVFERTGEIEGSFNFGLDLAALVRWEWLRFGLIGRNLNEPSFEGPTLSGERLELTVDRNLTAGLAVQPWHWWTVELSADLLTYRRLSARKEWKVLSLGTELKPLKRLPIRAGVYRNIDGSDSESQDRGFTLGIGYTGNYFQLEAAVGAAFDSVHYKDYELPKQLRASLGFGGAF